MMETRDCQESHRDRYQALAGVAVLLGLLLGVAGWALADDPPTWVPPEIVKAATEDSLGLGEQVVFTITLKNPAGPLNEVTWYHLTMTDAVDPALRIDGVALLPPVGEVAVIDHTVVATVPSLMPGQWSVTQVDCTLVGPAEPGEVITNGASLRYEAPDGTPRGPLEAPDPPAIVVLRHTLLPLVMRNSR